MRFGGGSHGAWPFAQLQPGGVVRHWLRVDIFRLSALGFKRKAKCQVHRAKCKNGKPGTTIFVVFAFYAVK